MDEKAFKDDPELLGRMLRQAIKAGDKVKELEKRAEKLEKKLKALERRIEEGE